MSATSPQAAINDEMADNPPPAKKLKTSRPTFDVLVGTGSDQQRFEVDHGIMTKHSKSFRVARSERWTSKAKPTELPEHDPSIFALYVDCLYDRAMPEFPVMARDTQLPRETDIKVVREHQGRVYDANMKLVNAHWRKLIGLHLLAGYLLDPRTGNMAIDQIRRFYYRDSKKFGDYYDLKDDIILLVLSSTRDGDALRNLFADFFVFDGEGANPDLPKEWFVLLWDRSVSLRWADRVNADEEQYDHFKNDTGSQYWETFHEYYVDVGDDTEESDE